MEFMCIILQGDEKQGMILIQDEGMDFQPSYIWILIKIFNNLWNNISCLKGVDNRVCFSAWDTMEISYHYISLCCNCLLISHFSPPSTHHMMNVEHQHHATSMFNIIQWQWQPPPSMMLPPSLSTPVPTPTLDNTANSHKWTTSGPNDNWCHLGPR